MGAVYKAKDLLKVEAQDRDPYVAIKVLNDECEHLVFLLWGSYAQKKGQHIINK